MISNVTPNLETLHGILLSIPAPKIYRGIKTLLKERPQCPVCDQILRDQAQYETHYILVHME